MFLLDKVYLNIHFQNHRIASAQSAIQELQFAAEVAGAESVVQKLMGLLERSQVKRKESPSFSSRL